MTGRDCTAIPDGGTEDQEDYEEADSDRTDRATTVNSELPDNALFDLEDYLKMYEIAAKEKPFKILQALSEETRLSTSELSLRLDADGNNLHYPLRQLKKTGLVENRRDPTTGTEEPYSYYELTDMAHIVLEKGLTDGIEALASDEVAFDETYSK